MKILKGNFTPKNDVEIDNDISEQSVTFESEFRRKAIEHIGGSMVFVERKKMVWDGEA